MKTIKFRAWHQKLKKWLDPYIVSVDGLGNIDVGGEETDQVTIVLFTGLTDKNGKEIYRGDICKNGDWEKDAHAYNYRQEVVEWDNDNACFIGWNYNEDGMTCEVIGNIYENPELVK